MAGRDRRTRGARSRARRTRRAEGRVLHLDTFSGIAGNMFLAALLDAGLPRKALTGALDRLGVGYTLRVSRVKRGAIAARYLHVGVPRAERRGHRHYDAIRRLIDAGGLAPAVRDRAQAIFAELAAAESRVHGIPVERVHFHEVGAVDAIVDITGAAIAIEEMGFSRITATPPAIGHGQVETAHGRLPLPAPATLELLRGIPTTPAHVAWETVTPTGAAILRSVVDEFCALPAMTVEAIGHGAGNDREGPLPNVLRAVVGASGSGSSDRVVVLEANLDDMVPEHFDHVMERLFEAGALDVTLQHLQMKKNRPGFLLRVVARPDRRTELAGRMLAETTTLGVRTSEWDRRVLARDALRVDTPFGRIRVKVAHGQGRADVSPEYDDCKRAARAHDVPIRDVVRAAEAAGRVHLDTGPDE